MLDTLLPNSLADPPGDETHKLQRRGRVAGTDGVEERSRDTDEFGLADSLHSFGTDGTRDDVQFSDGVVLTVLAMYVDALPVLLRAHRTKTAV